MKTARSSTYTASDARKTAMSWASYHTVTVMLHVHSKVYNVLYFQNVLQNVWPQCVFMFTLVMKPNISSTPNISNILTLTHTHTHTHTPRTHTYRHIHTHTHHAHTHHTHTHIHTHTHRALYIRVQRLINSKIAKAYRTTSSDALCIPTGNAPVELKAEEAANLYRITKDKQNETLDHETETRDWNHPADTVRIC
jgi:hypothetical protein